jgi:hypothetical protein
VAKQETDSRITKRRVTCKSIVPAGFDDDGQPQVHVHEMVDYVRPDFLDAYVADARTRWQSVEVSDEPDAGPGGYDGDTVIPPHIEGKKASAFDRYGTPSTPENALDESLGNI